MMKHACRVWHRFHVAETSGRAFVAVGLLLAMTTFYAGGCAGMRYSNSSPYVEQHIRASHNHVFKSMFKCSALYPARDILTADPLWRSLLGDEAWNAASTGVADSSFFTNRTPEELTPECVARGPCLDPPPAPPFRIKKVKHGHAARWFIGEDADGRKFLFKLDDPDYPELGTTATLVGTRVLWALGYNVPPTYLVRIEGTGDARFDGRRATAAAFLDNVKGHFQFDWFRYRRELRGLRLASAWLNDTDRVGTNTLVTVADGRAKYYLIDFDSCLGAWQGRPKDPWRGYRHQCSTEWALAELFTLGAVCPEPDAVRPVVSRAVGRFEGLHFDPLGWHSQAPNTAFDHMTAADRDWIIAKIRQLDRPQIEAIVAAAELSNPVDARYLVDTLMQRREAILGLSALPEQQSP